MYNYPHMIQKILKSTDPRLREISKPVKRIDKKVKLIIRDLKDTLAVQTDPEGVGLAAPQIGKNLRIFVANYHGFKKAVINPEILEISKEKTKKAKGRKEPSIMEGCLSLPYYYGPLVRAKSLKIKYLNEDGKEVVEEFKNFYAQIILHEIDHLDGILFIDRIIEQKRKLYKLEGDEWEEVELK